MVTIYQDYSDEPKDIFLPLPEELACQFYALEMDNFTADIDFYRIAAAKTGYHPGNGLRHWPYY